MFYKYKLKATELATVIPNVFECLFVIHTKLPERNYEAVVYKYDDCYFVLRDARILQQVKNIDHEVKGDEEELLSYIESALEDNLYLKVEKEFVFLDLNILEKAPSDSGMSIRYYEFIDL